MCNLSFFQNPPKQTNTIPGHSCVCINPFHHPQSHSLTHSLTHSLRRLSNDLIHRLSKIIHISRIQPGHTNPAILRHIDMLPLPQQPHLFLAQAGKTKHADLLRDMAPTPRRAQLLQLPPQRLPHLDDAPAHRPQVLLPLPEQRLVVEDQRRDAGAVGGRVGNLAALEDGELGGDAGDGVGGGGGGGGDEVEGAGALAVEAEVLGEGLRDAAFEAELDEVADGPGVVFEVAAGEALVGAVEEGEEGALAHDGRDLFPLVAGGVDAGGVVGAGVEEDDAAGGGGAQGREHIVEIEHFGFRGEVGVGGDGEVHVREDLVVVGPCRGAEVDRLRVWAREEFGEEEAAEVDGAGAGDGLERCDLRGVRGRWEEE